MDNEHLSGAVSGNSKEWKLIEKSMMQMSVEQRRSRRWGIFFKLLTFIYLFALLVVLGQGFEPEIKKHSGPFTAFVNLNGVIKDGEEASADNLVTGLRAAFKDENTKGVILRINSPGGSPVQAGYVYDEIKRLRGLHPDIKLYAVISDLGASGAYYIAAAADEIYADKASLVGSIGVVASSFGFVNTMEKLGVERRLYTAGAHKGFLDPFSPENSEEVKFWQNVLNTTHKQFINKVREGRGERLKIDENTFSGLVWSGEQALDKGLVDGLGSAGYVAREVVGAEDMVDFTPRPDPFEKFTKQLGVSMAKGLSQMVLGDGVTLK